MTHLCFMTHPNYCRRVMRTPGLTALNGLQIRNYRTNLLRTWYYTVWEKSLECLMTYFQRFATFAERYAMIRTHFSQCVFPMRLLRSPFLNFPRQRGFSSRWRFTTFWPIGRRALILSVGWPRRGENAPKRIKVHCE